jgi:hypothetical protein
MRTGDKAIEIGAWTLEHGQRNTDRDIPVVICEPV